MHRARFVLDRALLGPIGLLGPTEIGLPLDWTRALGLKKIGPPPLDSDSRAQSKSYSPLASGSRVQSKSDPALDSDSGARARSGSGLDSDSRFGRAWS